MLARITAVLCSLVLVAGVGVASFEAGARSAGGSTPAASTSSGGSLQFLEEILHTLDRDAVRAPDDQALIDAAVEGLLGALDDPYARYYDEDAFDDLNAMLDGGFSGIGIVLEERPAGLVVMSVFEDTPAARAGIEEGERITSVDGTPVGDRPIDVIVEQIKGDEGTEVTLGLAGGSEGRREVTLVRERIELPNVEYEVLEDGSGYVRLRQFTTGAGDKVRSAVDELVEQGVPGVVLDLRGNPGGLLSEAVNVASVFIEEGAIVDVKERGEQRRTFSAKGDAVEGLPLVVLINKGSASASEIVAGAIQDSERGTLVGVPTFGKGTVQTIHRLDAGGGVKYTTAEYFTPSGDSIEGEGVRPDRRVAGAEAQLAAAQETLAAMIAGGDPETS
ncbi:MAG TPA: S41 family peptidase [Egibacteraceae bacterium]|nr:S41 family peptidase [Egibacteraceae bacterium]